MTLLGRYIQLATLKAFAVVAVALTGLLSLFDFVEQLASVGEGRYRVLDALIYVVLTTPSRLLQVTPIALLLATLLALGSLARDSEYAAMSSLGVPGSRIIGSVLALTLPIVVALLLMAEFVIPPAQELAQARRTSALSPSMSFHAENSLWAQSGLEYLNVQQFGRGDVPIGVDIYTFAADGSLESLIHADRAQIRSDGTWLLTAVTRKRVRFSQFTTERLPSLPWHSFLAPQQVRFLFLPIQSIPPIALYSYIHTVEGRNQKLPQYESVFWDKVSIPLSMIAMVMIAAPFAFGPPRAYSTGRNLSLGIGFGIVYSLAQQVLSQIGLLLDLSPAVTALAPPLLVMAAAVSIFRDSYGLDTVAVPLNPGVPAP